MTQPPQPLPYQSRRLGKVSAMATTSMVLGAVSIPSSLFGIGVLLGIIALILGIISLIAINKDPVALGGKGYAITGMVTGTIGVTILVPLIILFRPTHYRTDCIANVHGILQATIVYSADNSDCFPIQNGTLGPSSTSYNLGSMYLLTTAAGGNGVSTKSFICPQDADITSPAVGTRTNFNTAAPLQCSYGIADPTFTGPTGLAVAPYWQNTMDSTVPLMSDLIGGSLAGKPAGNSLHHNGDGQNVGFGDAHAEWARSVVVTTGPGSRRIDISGKTGTRSFTAPYVTWINPQKPTPGAYTFK